VVEFGAWMAGYSYMSVDLGMEAYFVRKANAAGMAIIDLECAEMQMGLRASFSAELQEMLLLDALEVAVDVLLYNRYGKMFDMFDDLMWMQWIVSNGECGELAAYLRRDDYGDPLHAEHNRIMLDERDLLMAAIISEFLLDENDNGNYFVVIGAAHMIGENGIVNLLANMGFDVVRK
jgi:hypothetical protein